MTVTAILKEFKKLGNEKNRAGMARFGINADQAYGIKIPVLRALAKKIGRNHMLAIDLWQTKKHEARLLAIFIADKKQVTEELMELWLNDFNSWDLCDQAIMNLFDKHPLAYKKAIEWSKRKEEFQRRAGFAMMASLAVHDKKMADSEFKTFYLPLKNGARDERIFVKKAVNWAIRQMGKRSRFMCREMIQLSKDIAKIDSKSARWIAADALRELQDKKIVARIKR